LLGDREQTSSSSRRTATRDITAAALRANRNARGTAK